MSSLDIYKVFLFLFSSFFFFFLLFLLLFFFFVSTLSQLLILSFISFSFCFRKTLFHYFSLSLLRL